jgi:hypothetical protein
MTAISLRLPLLLCAIAIGCRGGNSRIAAPDINPAQAAKALLQEYDADHDGYLSAAECKKFPAVQGALPFYDVNGDEMVTQDELKSRLQTIVGTKVGLMSFFCRVDLDGAPLAGAKVELVPEPALASVLKTAEGTTDAKGAAQIAIPDANLPESDRGLSAMMPGLYRVRITHPEKNLPEQFNTKTTLGQEVAGDSLVGKQPMVYDLHK